MDKVTVVLLLLVGFMFESIQCMQYPPGYPAEKQRTAYACEGSFITLRCKRPDEKLRIVVANYGRFSMMVCNQDGMYQGIDLTCSSKTSMQVVTQRCDRRYNCTLHANDELFGGDPCPGTKKYIQIQYFCEKDEKEKLNDDKIKFDGFLQDMNLSPRQLLMKMGVDVNLDTADHETPTPSKPDESCPVVPKKRAKTTKTKTTMKTTENSTTESTSMVAKLKMEEKQRQEAALASSKLMAARLLESTHIDNTDKHTEYPTPHISSPQADQTIKHTQNPSADHSDKQYTQNPARHNSTPSCTQSTTMQTHQVSNQMVNQAVDQPVQQNFLYNYNTGNTFGQSPYGSSWNYYGNNYNNSAAEYIAESLTSEVVSPSSDCSKCISRINALEQRIQSLEEKVDTAATTSTQIIQPVTPQHTYTSPFNTSASTGTSSKSGQNESFFNSPEENIQANIWSEGCSTYDSGDVDLVVGYPGVRISVEQLDVCLRKAKSSGTALARLLCGVYFTDEVLQRSSARGTKDKPALDSTIINAITNIEMNKTSSTTHITSKPVTDAPLTTEDEVKIPTTEGGHRPGVTEKWTGAKRCRSNELASVYWPASPADKLIRRPCPHGKLGTAFWQCGQDGEWIGKPDLTDCVSKWMSEIQDLVNGNGPADRAVGLLNNQLRGKVLAVGDLKKATSGVLPALVSKLRGEIDPDLPLHKKKEKIHSFNKAIVKTGSTLLSKEHQAAWEDLEPAERQKSATSLIVCMEQMALEMSTAMTTSDTVSSSEQNLVMEVSVIKMATTKHSALTLPRMHYDMGQTGSNNNFSLPMDGFSDISATDDATVTYLYYHNLESLMNPADSNQAPGGRGTIHSINSNIISASVLKHSVTADSSPQDHIKLSRPMNFTMANIQKVDNNVPLCSFWRYNRSTLVGEWSQEGCHVIETNDQHTTCQCDHLTNFAILLSVSDTEISKIHQMSLQAITYVGCTVSIICLLMCFVSFTIFRNLQSDRNTIHKNLVMCLMLAELLFLFGIGQTESRIACKIVAIFLHFLFLASFSWMCLEGIQLYFMLIEVFEAERSRVRWFYALGYGVPLLIVAISAGVDHTSYGTDRHCWLSTDNYFILSFVIPAAIVILINIAMLSIAVYMMCRHAGVTASSIQARKKGKLEKMGTEKLNNGKYSIASDTNSEKSHLEMPTWLKGSAVLVVLLGLTWTFGFLYVSDSTIVMAYIFTILNSLQGLFIFIFHCFMDRKVKKEWRKAIYRATWLPLCCRVNIGGYDASLSSPPTSSSGPQNYFMRFWSSRKRKRSTSSANTKNRRSDLDSFLRTDTSSGCTTGTGVNRYSNQSEKLLPNGGNVYTAMPTHVEDGVAGDLSVIDASVIDSEYVTEYCQQNLQVSREERQYSSDSDDEVNHDNASHDTASQNRLSRLSNESLGRVNSEFTSDNEGSRNNFTVLDEKEGEGREKLMKKNGVLQSENDRNLLNDILNLYENAKITNGNSVSTERINNVQGCKVSSANNKTKSEPDLKTNIRSIPPSCPNTDLSSEPLLGSSPDLSSTGEDDNSVDQDSKSLKIESTS